MIARSCVNWLIFYTLFESLIACERRRISGGDELQPEIRLRSMAKSLKAQSDIYVFIKRIEMRRKYDIKNHLHYYHFSTALVGNEVLDSLPPGYSILMYQSIPKPPIPPPGQSPGI